jgi:hypothetical protein
MAAGFQELFLLKFLGNEEVLLMFSIRFGNTFILDDLGFDGEMLKVSELMVFGRRHGLVFLTICYILSNT